MDSLFSHAVVGQKERPQQATETAGGRVAGPAVPQPQAASALGVQVEALVADRPSSSTWRARNAEGHQVALVVVSQGASAATRERFARIAEDLHAAGDAVSGVLRVRAVAPSRDAFVSDLWTMGTANDLSALRWSLRRRLEFVRQVARALETLHGVGLVHGCLCPTNVLLDDELQPVLAEAGLVSVTAQGETAHYAAFAAPEVRAGEPPDECSDVYSAGRLLEELVKGEAAPDVSDIVRSCLAPPEFRYAAAADLERALSTAMGRLPVEEATSSAPPPNAVPRSPPAPPPTKPPSQRTLPSSRSTPRPNPAPAARASLVSIRPGPGRFEGAGRTEVLVAVAGAMVGAATFAAAFLRGGANPTLRGLLAILLPLGVAAATLVFPHPRRYARVTSGALALALGALVVIADPLAHAYRAVAQRHLYAEQATRRASISELIRLGRDFRGVWLSGADLSGFDLTGADLRGADLSHANLSSTKVVGARVEGASFQGAQLDGADLERTSLGQALDVESATCNAATRLPSGWRCAAGYVLR